MQIVTYAVGAGNNRIPLMQGKRFVKISTAVGQLTASYGNAAGQEMRIIVSQFTYEPYTPIYVDEGDYLLINVGAATTVSIGYVD